MHRIFRRCASPGGQIEPQADRATERPSDRSGLSLLRPKLAASGVELVAGDDDFVQWRDGDQCCAGGTLDKPPIG